MRAPYDLSTNRLSPISGRRAAFMLFAVLLAIASAFFLAEPTAIRDAPSVPGRSTVTGDAVTPVGPVAGGAERSGIDVDGTDDVVRLTSIVNYRDSVQNVPGAKMHIIVFRKRGA